jgi:hypothetical protein
MLKVITSPILMHAPSAMHRFCDRCGNKFIPLYGTFHNLCPGCSNIHNEFKLNLAPSFEETLTLINGGYSKQIFHAREIKHPWEREQLLKNIRNRIVVEWHTAGIFTYEELEILFGLKTRRLHELSKQDHHNLLAKNCEICGKIMEFGNNRYLYEQKRFCSPKCKSDSRRKCFRFLKKS